MIILSEIEHGFPIRVHGGHPLLQHAVGCDGRARSQVTSRRKDSESIGFIGSGEQAKMHLIAMKTALSLAEGHCRVGAKTEEEEEQFVAEMSRSFPDMEITGAGTSLQKAGL